MCVRSVFVLVFMCCVNSRAQWDPNNSPGYTYTTEHSGMPPNGMPPQSGPLSGLSNSPENPIIHPQIISAQNEYSDDSNYPESQGLFPQYNPPSDHPNESINPDMYPQGMAPQYDLAPGLEDPSNNPKMNPQGMPPQNDPSPGHTDLSNNPYMHPHGIPPQNDPSPERTDLSNNPYLHPQGMPPQNDPSSRFPDSPNYPYMHPQEGPPQYDASSGYSENSDNPHLQPHVNEPPNDPPSRFPNTPHYPYIITQPQGRPPPYGPSPETSNVPENPYLNPQGMPPQHHPYPETPDIREHPYMHPHKMPPPFGLLPDYADDPDPPGLSHRPALVQHAGLPQKLEVFPLPLENSYHELKFNVSWVPTMGGVANGYSLEVWSLTETDDCQPPNSPTNVPMCYEYNIAGNVTWSLIPALPSTAAETCAIRPGCVYNVKLKSDPWDGHTAANLLVELDECVKGVCSCAHSPRLPVPVVSAQSVTIKDKIYSNISWTLPTPSFPQRLPSAKLGKQSYIVNLCKQVVTNAISAPWFANVMRADVDADGLVSEGDTVRSVLFPISELMELNVKLIARVQLVDGRGCIGLSGNATVFDPAELSKSKYSFGVYAILGALIGAWAMGAVFVLSARVVKRVLKSFRPAPVSAPLEPLRGRPAWFPLQLRT